MSKTVDRLRAEESRLEKKLNALRSRLIAAEHRMYAGRKCAFGRLRCKCRGKTKECHRCGKTLCAFAPRCGECA